MPYECQKFKNGQILTAECLNKIEQALAAICDKEITAVTVNESGGLVITFCDGTTMVTDAIGAAEVVISSEEPTDESAKVWINPDEEDSGVVSSYVNISAVDGYSCSTPVSTLEALLGTGLIVAKITTDTGVLFAPLCSYETSADNSYGRVVVFALGIMTFTLTPTDSDSYEVTVSGD